MWLEGPQLTRATRPFCERNMLMEQDSSDGSKSPNPKTSNLTEFVADLP
jgi:hypothetical protein